MIENNRVLMATLRSDVQKLFPLKSTKDVLQLFRKQMESDVPDLALISITTGSFHCNRLLDVFSCLYFFCFKYETEPALCVSMFSERNYYAFESNHLL